MASVFIPLPVPAGDGVGAWVDVSSQGPEKTVSVDGGPFGGTILLEGSNDGQVSAGPAACGPFVAPTFAAQTFTQAFNFMRVRRVNSGGVGAPTVNLGAPAAIASVFGAMAVPAGDGVGASIDISAGGDVNTFQVAGATTDQIIIEVSTDGGVTFSPTLLFLNGGGVGQQVIGALSAARVRRRVRSVGGPTPVVSVGSSATAGAAGGAFPGFGAAPPAVAVASSGGVAGTASKSDHTHAGTSSVNAATGAATFAAADGSLTVAGAAPALTFAVNYGGVPPAVGDAGSAGAAVTASRSDHTHLGVTSVNGASGAVVVTGFPGFGGAPPTVATASAAGAAGTASHSDHTHGLDLVTYTPSAAGMQAAGVVQQTFPGPTAVPSVLTMVVGQVPFGAATHLLTQSADFVATIPGANKLLVTLGTNAVGHAGGLLVNTTNGGAGISIGGGIGAGVYVADPNAAGEANIACDDGFFGLRLVGFAAGAFNELDVGVAPGNALHLSYGMDRVGTHSDVLSVDGATGELTMGDITGAKVVFDLKLSVGNAPDLALGFNALVAGSVHGYPYMPAIAATPTGAADVFGNAFAAHAYDTTKHGMWARNSAGAQWEFMPAANTTLPGGAGILVTTNAPAGFGTTFKWWSFTGFGGAVCVVPYLTNP